MVYLISAEFCFRRWLSGGYSLDAAFGIMRSAFSVHINNERRVGARHIPKQNQLSKNRIKYYDDPKYS
jgi:hypothetical protein